MIKAGVLGYLFGTFKNNPVAGFWDIFLIFLIYVTYEIFLSLTNKYRGYSILFAFIYLCFLQITFDQFYNLSKTGTIGLFLRYVLIFCTIFFIIQNNYLTKKLIPLSMVNIFPAMVMQLTVTYQVLVKTSLEQDVIGIFPNVNNAADLYLYLIKNNLFFPFINELLATSTLIESLSVIMPILFELIENIIICLGIYYWATYIVLDKLSKEEQKNYGE